MSVPILISFANAQHVRLFGADIYFTMPLAEGGGGVSVFEEIRPPNNGPPIHLHRHEDEIVRVLEGRHRLRVGQDDFELGPGDTIFLPRGIPHAYANCGERPGHVIFIAQPGGLERYFIELATAQQLHSGRDAGIRAKYGVEYVGRNPFIK
jgi:mannose-6-phosphate isomerase-like protein (cupin superfamily)